MRFFLGVFVLIFSELSHASFYVGNGGDVLTCQPSPSNDLSGYYSLDHILTTPVLRGDAGLAKVTSWRNSSERIEKILLNKVPSLAPLFRDFTRLVFNRSFTEMRIWEPAPFGLVELKDERIVGQVPDNCRIKGELKVIQAVIRQFEAFSGTTRGRYVYRYFPEVIDKMDASVPGQLSFLLVHEWLWDLSSNVDRNRRINRFLHSTEIESLSPAEVVGVLQGMGLQIPSLAADAFNPDLWQGYPLTNDQFFKRFSGYSVVRNLGTLKLDYRDRRADCTIGSQPCDPNWSSRKPFASYVETLANHHFALAASWTGAEGRDFPIKIVSTTLAAAEGRIFNSNVGEIRCEFKENGEFNLACQIVNSRLERASMAPQPLLGKVTEESFRLLIPGHRQIHVVDFNGRSYTEEWLTETVFTTRFRW